MHPEAAGLKSRLDPTTPRDHRPGRLGHQRLPLLHQLAHGGPKKQGVDQETARRNHGHRGLFNMTNALANGYQIEPDIKPPLD